MPDTFKTTFYGKMVLKGSSQNLVFGFSDTNDYIGGGNRILNSGSLYTRSFDFTNAENVYLIIGNGSGININNDIPAIFNNYDIMISKEDIDYEPYNGDTYELDLGTLKMRGIGTYEDYFVRNSGKNLVEWHINSYAIGSNGRFASNSDYDMHIAQVIQGKTYTVTTNEAQLVAGFFTELPTINSTSYDGSRIVQNEKTFIAPITGYIAFRSSIGYQFAQLELGNSSSTYEPYGTGQWCKYNAILPKIFTGDSSEDWKLWNIDNTNTQRFYISIVGGWAETFGTSNRQFNNMFIWDSDNGDFEHWRGSKSTISGVVVPDFVIFINRNRLITKK